MRAIGLLVALAGAATRLVGEIWHAVTHLRLAPGAARRRRAATARRLRRVA
jgi:hypothetical protein